MSSLESSEPEATDLLQHCAVLEERHTSSCASSSYVGSPRGCLGAERKCSNTNTACCRAWRCCVSSAGDRELQSHPDTRGWRLAPAQYCQERDVDSIGTCRCGIRRTRYRRLRRCRSPVRCSGRPQRSYPSIKAAPVCRLHRRTGTDGPTVAVSTTPTMTTDRAAARMILRQTSSGTLEERHLVP